MQTKEELLEIERRLLVEMGRRYGAHLEKAAAARRARSRERARRAREAAIQGIRTTEYERNQIVQKRRKT